MRHTPTFKRPKDYSGVESYKGRRFATGTGSGKSVFVFALMSIGFDCDDRPSDELTGFGEMSVHKLKFVLVNNMAPRNPCVCAACSRSLQRGYLRDLSTSKRYCGIECYPNGWW
jgi:hypothetical protein